MANKTVKIDGVVIGDGFPVFLVAEIGINHNGSIEITKKLIDAAFACNWNCVKFQKRTPEICVPPEQRNVLRDTPWGRITYLEYRHKLEFGKDEYDYIRSYCQEKPILWSASAWDIPSIDFLLTYDVPFIKIPSAKLTEAAIIVKAAESGKAVFLSTGMSTVAEIDTAVNLLEKHSKGNYLLMHAVSTYPTPPEESNLRVIEFLKNRYHCVIGYSGHEYDLGPSTIAVALGASVVERHVTLNHNMWGSDHFASLEVHAMDLLLKRIRNVEIVLGNGEKTVSAGEMEIRKKLRG